MMVYEKTGRRYVYVFPKAPAFEELRQSYAVVADRQPWFAVYEEHEATNLMLHADERTFIAFWGRPDFDALSMKRKCFVAFVESEPLGPLQAMTADGKIHRKILDEMAPYLDGVFLHTPAMRDQMKRLRPKLAAEVLPAGLDPSIVVEPDWDCEKNIDVLFYGAMVGKRLWSAKMVQQRLNSSFSPTIQTMPACLFTQSYGRELGDLLNRSKINLYLAHSDVTSFSTWRIWQTLATSSLLAAESFGATVDAWPLVPNRHYLQLPMIDRDSEGSIDRFVEKLKSISMGERHLIVHRARTEIWPHFSAERCVTDYLVPAAERIIRARS